MRWIMSHRKLLYLLDDNPVKLENNLPVLTAVQLQDANTFCAILMESIHEDNIFVIEDCTHPREMWNALKARHQQISAGSRFFHL